MAAVEIDAYLTGLEDPQRATLDEMRRLILVLIPQAEQVISYRLPGFKLNGTMIAGLAAFARHNSYLPHSGSVLPALADELTAYTRTKSALHFPVDEPLPLELIRRLLQLRLDEAGLDIQLEL